MPRISVILPSFNAEAFLDKAVASLIRQSFRDFEIILIDDGSVDSTADRIARWAERDRRIVPIFNERNLGLTPTLNKGLRLASGEFAARLDADDISDPQRLAKQLAFLETHPEVVLLGSNEMALDPTGRITAVGRSGVGGALFRWMSYFAPPIVHSSAMFRLEPVRERSVYYDEGMAAAQDMEYWQRLLDHGEGVRLDEALVSVLVHADSVSRRARGVQADCARRTCLARLSRDFPEIPQARLRRLADTAFGLSPVPSSEVSETILVMEQVEDSFRSRHRMSREEERVLRRHVVNRLVIGATRYWRAGERQAAAALLWSLRRRWPDLLAEAGAVITRRAVPRMARRAGLA